VGRGSLDFSGFGTERGKIYGVDGMQRSSVEGKAQVKFMAPELFFLF